MRYSPPWPGAAVRAVATLAAVGLTAIAPPAPLAAQPVRLGEVSFPVSATGAAAREFRTGVLYLHSFEYDSAAAAFRRAQQRAPHFAMAYWGEAMTYTHPVWNQQDTAAARAALGRLAPTREARRAAADTPRERDYLDAVEVLYGPGPKAARDTAYAAAMARVAAAHPEDAEAQTFFALALLGLNQGERDVPTYMRAAAIAGPVFAAHPTHPGAAHYLIHAFDDPAHAPLGLPAARAYSGIAPDAPHAQHMTSHIFLALGMWDATVHANEVASTYHDSAGRSLHLTCGHYGEWLQYAYLQQGRPKAAANVMAECGAQIRNARNSRPQMGRSSLAHMRAVQIVDGMVDTAPAAGDSAGLSAYGRAFVALGDAHAAAHRGDTATLRTARATLAGLPDALPSGYGEIATRQTDGLLARATGDSAAALAALRRAAAVEDSLPVEFGPPLVVKPSHELLGETLLALGRPADARVEFDRQLTRTPRRAATLLDLARAARAAGDPARAATALAELADVSRHAEPDAPVRAALAAGAGRTAER